MRVSAEPGPIDQVLEVLSLVGIDRDVFAGDLTSCDILYQLLLLLVQVGHLLELTLEF